MIAGYNAEPHGDGMKGYGRLMSRSRVVLFFTVGGILISGCGVLGSPPVQPVAATASAPSSDAPATAAAVPAASDAPAPSDAFAAACKLGTSGADVEVAIGNPQGSCGSWISNLAHDGLVWFDITGIAVPGSPGPADQETMGTRCDLTDGTQEMLVEDAGGAVYGDSICSAEEQNGWTPESGPMGVQANAAEASANAAEASAQASESAAAQAAAQASASAALQQQTVDDDQSVNSAVSTLQSDNKTYAADLETAKKDYKTVSAEPMCNADGSSNQNTYDDAQNVYDDGQTVYDDESTLSNDISSAQDAVSSLNSDLAAAGGTQGSTPAANDITTAQQVIANAQQLENADESSKIQSEAEDIQTKVDACPGG